MSIIRRYRLERFGEQMQPVVFKTLAINKTLALQLLRIIRDRFPNTVFQDGWTDADDK